MNIAWLKFGDVSTKQTSCANLAIYSPVVAIRMFFFFMFTPIWWRFPFWLYNIFRCVETTNQFWCNCFFVRYSHGEVRIASNYGAHNFCCCFPNIFSRLTQQFFVGQFLGGFWLRPIETKPYLWEGICTRWSCVASTLMMYIVRSWRKQTTFLPTWNHKLLDVQMFFHLRGIWH